MVPSSERHGVIHLTESCRDWINVGHGLKESMHPLKTVIISMDIFKGKFSL